MAKITTNATALFGPDAGQSTLVNQHNDEFVHSAAAATDGGGSMRGGGGCGCNSASDGECGCFSDANDDSASNSNAVADFASLLTVGAVGGGKRRKKKPKRSRLTQIKHPLLSRRPGEWRSVFFIVN